MEMTTSVSDGAVLYEVMRHAEWRIKAAFPLLCRQCLQQSRQQSHWDFLARCLQADFLLHVPAITGLVTRELFLELWLTRHLFVPVAPRPRLLGTAADGGEPADELAEEPEVGGELSLSVCCRFRPSVADAGGEETGAEEKVVVPLHQRIQQVRASRPGISRAAALRLVMANQLPAPDIPFQDGDDASKGEVPVAAQSEQKAGVLRLDSTAERGEVLAMVPGVGLRSFQFERVFGERTAQESVYDSSAARLVMDFINGQSGSAIVYGQTGSGKTYSMFGQHGTQQHDADGAGIVPRACAQVLHAIGIRRDAGVTVTLTMSFVEM